MRKLITTLVALVALTAGMPAASAAGDGVRIIAGDVAGDEYARLYLHEDGALSWCSETVEANVWVCGERFAPLPAGTYGF